MDKVATKGAAFSTVTSFLRELVSPKEFLDWKESLPPSTRDLVDHPPLAMALLPFVHTQITVGAAVKVLGEERAKVIYGQIGARMTKHDLSTIYRVLMRIVSIDYVIEKASKIYGQYGKGLGTLRLERHGNTVIARYRQLPWDNAVWGHVLGGAAAGVIEVAGGKNVRLTKVDVVRGEGLDVHIAWD